MNCELMTEVCPSKCKNTGNTEVYLSRVEVEIPILRAVAVNIIPLNYEIHRVQQCIDPISEGLNIQQQAGAADYLKAHFNKLRS